MTPDPRLPDDDAPVFDPALEDLPWPQDEEVLPIDDDGNVLPADDADTPGNEDLGPLDLEDVPPDLSPDPPQDLPRPALRDEP
jgi:hypothetical protein